jgi:autotransporter-associated beta strand protein
MAAMGSARVASAQVSWTGGAGADDLWGTGANWSTGVAPVATDNVLFGNADVQVAPGVVNNIVAVNRTIASLTYSNLASVGFHTTQINPGATLSIAYTSATVGNVLTVGTNTSVNNSAQLLTTMTGGGTLALSGTNGVMVIRQGVNTAAPGTGTQTAILDMSSLANFTADINRIVIGAEGTAEGGVANDPNGTLYLAQNNLITTRNTAEGINIGDASANPSTNASNLFLGQSNVINTNRIKIGFRKSVGTLAFKSGLVNPTLTVRGTAGGTNRMAALLIGDNGSTTGTSFTATGTADLRGGTVDMLVDQMILGRGYNATSTLPGGARGVLTWDKGTIDANTVLVGADVVAGAQASGTINVNAGATFIVRTSMELARRSGSNTNIANGTLNIGGTVNMFGNIIDTGGLSTLNITGGLLDMKPSGKATGGNMGTATNPIDVLNVASGTVANLGNGFVSSLTGSGAFTGLTGTLMVDTAGTPTFGGSISGSGGVSKTNTGTLTLNGSLNFTGATTVHSGTLAIGATTSLTNSATIDVRTGGTLDASAGGLSVVNGQTVTGSGTILGAVSAAPGAKVLPGGATVAGTLTMGNALSLNGTALALDLSSDPSTVGSNVNDLISVGGDLSLAGVNMVTLNALNGALTTGTYRLINYNGSLSGGSANFAVAGSAGGSRRTFTFDTATAGQVNLTIGGSDPLALVWKGNGTTNRWNLNGDQNWNNNTQKFFNLDSVTFDDSGSTTPSIELVGDLAPGAIAINSASNYFFVGAGRLTGGAGLTKDGTGKATFGNTGVNDFFGSITINAGTVAVGLGGTAGTLGVGPVTVNGTLSFNRSDDLTVTNNISGAGVIEKHGGGVLTLAGNNSFTGSITILAGTLRPASSAAMGDTNSGSITIGPETTLDLNSVNHGLKAIQAQGAGFNNVGAIISNGPTDQLNALANVTLTGNTTFGGGARWDVRASNGVGVFNAAGFNLTKVGTNRVQLAGLGETQLGNVAINEGILGFETTTTQGIAAKTITIAPAGTLAYFNTGTTLLDKNIVSNGGRLLGDNGASTQAGAITLNATTIFEGGGGGVTFTGPIGGAGGLIKNGTSDIVLNGLNNYSGSTTVNAGFLRGTVDGLQGQIVIAVTGTGTGVVYQNTADGVSRATFSGPGNLLAGTGLGTNIVTLPVANSYGGLTAMNAGVFRLANGMALGATNVGTYPDGGARTGQVQLSNNITVPGEYLGMIGRATGNNAAHLLNFSGNNTWAGTVATALAAESTNATGVGNTYTLESAAGTLTISGDVVNNISGAPGTAVATLRLQGDATGLITGNIGGTAVGSFSIDKSGNGTWTLTGTGNTYTGATTVDGGTLRVLSSIATSSGVTVNAGGTFDAGATQTVKALSVSGGQARVTSVVGTKVLTVGDGTQATSQLSLTGGRLGLTTNGLAVHYAAGAGNDAAALASVRAQVIAGYNPSSPTAGDGKWDGATGITSSSIGSLNAVGYALAADVLPFTNGTTDTFLGTTVDKNTVIARYTLSGDVNLDGAVDFLDLARLAQSYNVTDGTRQWSTGDFNFDGNTDFLDLAKLAQNYNTALPGPLAGASSDFNADLARAFASVPEPGIGLFGAATVCGLIGRRRRRNKR